jgi:uncharacterized repeat protein (TIGR03803 family)
MTRPATTSAGPSSGARRRAIGCDRDSSARRRPAENPGAMRKLIPVLAVALVAAAGCSDAPEPAGQLAVWHSFSGADGAWSRGSLSSDGHALYGRTSRGGEFGSGTVFRLDGAGGGFRLLHSFTAGGDNHTGNQPHHNAMLVRDSEVDDEAVEGELRRGSRSLRCTAAAARGDAPPRARSPTRFVAGAGIARAASRGTRWRNRARRPSRRERRRRRRRSSLLPGGPCAAPRTSAVCRPS